jgi:tRNA threonylcarbamoyladenosine modification (KEOPS) complex  Pcc1 subunit
MSRRRATIRTEHDAPDVVAAALAPDNTPEMQTRVEAGSVVTTIERETTSGLRSTVDDYVRNLQVAQQMTDTPNTT